MSAKASFRYSRVLKSALSVICGLIISQQAGAWQTTTESVRTTNGDAVAFERNSRGDISEVYRSDSGEVFLHITLAPGFIKFSPSNCPTLQIDKRVPVHHYEAGPTCSLSTDSVKILIAKIDNSLAISLPLHRLMNGSQLAVRFVTASGEYRESVFSLRNSKQALQTALGETVRVEPKDDSASGESEGG